MKGKGNLAMWTTHDKTAIRSQIAEIEGQLTQFKKIRELYNVNFDFDSRRLERAISQLKLELETRSNQQAI